MVLLNLYRFLVVPLYLSLAGIAAALGHRKLRAGWRARWQARELQKPIPPGAGPWVWFHAASGEFEYVKPVIRELKSLRPDINILCTYFSPTFAPQIQSNAFVDYSLPLPLDLPGPIRSLIKRFQPSLLLIARTDLWPEVLEQCRVAYVPRILMAAPPLKNSGLLRWLKVHLLKQLDQIWFIRDEDTVCWQSKLPQVSLRTLGDPRYDQVAQRLQETRLPANTRAYLSRFKVDSLILIGGSTWPEDEQWLLDAMVALNDPRLKLILVPHEPSTAHIQKLKQQLTQRKFSFVTLSDLAGAQIETNAEVPVLIVDSVGYLSELYLYGDLAFIGGSVGREVHSVMEALVAGLLVIVGPNHLKNSEALEFQKLPSTQEPAVVAVSSASELITQLKTLLVDRPNQWSQTIKALAATKMGAGRTYAEAIADLIKT